MSKAEPEYASALRAIKRALDPGDVIAPGHFLPVVDGLARPVS